MEGKGTSKIVLLDLSGMLAEDVASFSIGAPPPKVPLLARVREELRKAEDDERVKALIVRINSPGGTITASDILYHEILAFKTRKKVPVIAAIMDVGASGGYYAALAADTIVVHPTTVTGSIGVVMITVNAQGLLEKIGVAPLAIKSGPMKDAGSPFRPLTAPELPGVPGLIDDMYGRFVRLIASRGRCPRSGCARSPTGASTPPSRRSASASWTASPTSTTSWAGAGSAPASTRRGWSCTTARGYRATIYSDSRPRPPRGAPWASSRASSGQRAALSVPLVALGGRPRVALGGRTEPGRGRSRSSASRTLCPSAAGVKGFWMNMVSGSSTPWRTIASFV